MFGQIRVLWLWACALTLIGACAADGGGDEGGSRVPRTGVSGGAGDGAGSTTDPLGGFNNPTGTPPPAAPGGAGSSGGQSGGQGLEPVVIEACPSGLDPAAVAQLEDPGAPTDLRLLYPYDGTVFPRGLAAPAIQWDGAMGDAVLLVMRSNVFEYRGCFNGISAVNVQIPQDVWDMAGIQSQGAGDPLHVEVSILSGGSVHRLPPMVIKFALANLKGAIYYNTYGSLLAQQMGVIGGVVMRVLPGEPDPAVFLTAPDPIINCIGCHAVSADGTRMVAEIHGQPGLIEGPSSSFDIAAVGSGVNPPPLLNNLSRAGFSALYPDGSIYLTTGRTELGPFGALAGAPPGNITGTFGPEQSKLYDTNTGAEIAGSGIEPYAYMPMFSVDGSMVIFNRMAPGGAGGKSLAVMDFDRTTNSFKNPREVFSDPAQYPAWPFFLPEVESTADELVVPQGKRAVFALAAVPDFVTQEAPVGIVPHLSDLWWVDLDTGMASPLNAANGLDAGGGIYLPYGERDAHRNYLPTVSPVAAGGYFWMFFTSKRNVGNQFIADPPEQRAESKKIWVAAIDIDATPGSDPSHPAFFLPGQELESGNIRAFAALEPCRAEGDACDSGIDCCCGACREGSCGCVDGCARLDEACETSADCCEEDGTVCIGGFCGFPAPE